jgi:hypothetical protein
VGFRGKENKVAGTARNGPTATAAAAAALTGCWGNARLVPPSLIDTLRASSRKRKMSEAKFNKAVKIVQSLPKDGPIKPTQDDQLYVRTPVFFFFVCLPTQILISPHPHPQFYSYYKQGVCCEAQSRVI